MPVFLAYDGSINGDWVAHYALRLAAHIPERTLIALHVDDGRATTLDTTALVDALRGEDSSSPIEIIAETLSSRHGVFASLLARIPDGPNTLVVCGLRVKADRRGYLAGTVSEQLLRHRGFETLAVRVVQPGLLGHAKRILLPVGGNAAGLRAGLPVLKLLGHDATRIHVLRIATLGRAAYRATSAEHAAHLLAQGRAYAARVESLVIAATGLNHTIVHPVARVSDDWGKEVLIQAGRLHSDLILMEIPRTSLRSRFQFGNPIEKLLRDTPCDVALYRGAELPETTPSVQRSP